MNTLLILGSVFLVSLMSFAGLLVLAQGKILKQWLEYIVALAAGTLLGDALIHLLPHYAEEFGYGITTGALVIIGVLIFFVLERFLHWHHCHSGHKHKHTGIVGINLVVADGFHNFIDGALIAAAYILSIPAGIATTIAVLLHEIPQEIADFGVLLHAGYSKKKALLMNFISALMALLGAIITIILVESTEFIEFALVPITVGAFIYIALADLLPELEHEERALHSVGHFLAFILGIGIMALLLVLG